MLSFTTPINFICQSRLGLSIIFLTWLAFFARTLIGQSVYFLDDLKIIFYPLEIAYASFQATWSLPEWSPLFGFGQPLLAWNQLGFFTPVHVMLRFLNLHPLNLLQVSIVTYFAIGLLGMFSILIHWRFSQLAAALGAIIFVFGGFHVGHLNHVNFYTGTMVLPWLMLLVTYFIYQPTLFRAALLALISAIIPLSAQPQIALYTLLAAAFYGLIFFAYHLKILRLKALKVIALTVLATLLFLGLSSFSTLPLREFLPYTERADGLSETELLEFSYPPYHAITLIFPELFGGHANYWGAKGFQELSAYLGIIPIFLFFMGLLTLRGRHPLYPFSLLLVTITLLFALGKYSPLYNYLVINKFITSVSIPGRFVFFGTIAISMLAPLGLDSFFRYRFSSLLPRAITASLLTVAPFIPFFISLQRNPHLQTAIQKQLSISNPTFWAFIGGIILIISTIPLQYLSNKNLSSKAALVIVSAISLVIMGWNINPLTPRHQAFVESPLVSRLQSYRSNTGFPARLYSRPDLYIDRTTLRAVSTGTITPNLTVIASLPAGTPACLSIPAYADPATNGTLNISLGEKITSSPLEVYRIKSDQILNNEISVCFRALNNNPNSEHYLFFTSSEYSGINVYFTRQSGATDLYLVRQENPEPKHLERSLKKDLSLLLKPIIDKPYDPIAVLQERHLNVAANTSSARWIGALSLRPYREFIETFYANDRDDLVDGDDVHILKQNRHLMDMAGITHLAQSYPKTATDLLSPTLDLPIQSEFHNGSDIVRLYQNPSAYPKAWLVPTAEFVPAADHTRTLLRDPAFNPRQLVYINSPLPPDQNQLVNPQDPNATLNVVSYRPTSVIISTQSSFPTWLVVSDNTTPEWQTFIDSNPAPTYIANTMFKSAYVPAGEHLVEFRYHSPAIQLAKKLTLIALALTLLLLITPLLKQFLTVRGSRISP